jgi:hypothetical protein
MKCCCSAILYNVTSAKALQNKFTLFNLNQP